MKKNTVSIHRIIQASPEKVFRAFSNPVAQSFWLPPYGFLCTVEQFDFKVEGTYKMTFINFTTQKAHSFGGTFHEIKENEFIRFSDTFDDPNMPGEMTSTVRLHPVSCGTELEILQEGIPDQIPAEMCYLGWQESIEKLIKLVEPNIPDV
ncbi:SRPBCC family protein [Sphingobacterium hungaricum]|uniref:Polyketide cyclase n=1 Tax=Sphingobacterium hungaricum TaxID=2082723 RepID=A0A928UWF8_9SPHI|nr:SRPBCC family protein [Sphingobacterium hungaricum]MBE8714233.1 polyketide cyclase [Sphingobacterium hungaricum]